MLGDVVLTNWLRADIHRALDAGWRQLLRIATTVGVEQADGFVAVLIRVLGDGGVDMPLFDALESLFDRVERNQLDLSKAVGLVLLVDLYRAGLGIHSHQAVQVIIA